MIVILQFPFKTTDVLGKIMIEWLTGLHLEKDPDKPNPLVHAERIEIKDD